MNSQPPETASDEIRNAIIEALNDPQRRRFSEADHTSRNYLDLWGIKPIELYKDLAGELEQFHLFLLPKKNKEENQKYQYILSYPEEPEYPSIIVHVKINPRGDPPAVMISVHSHNTGHSPLPQLPL